jgi:anti-sigma B factor antagonist
MDGRLLHVATEPTGANIVVRVEGEIDMQTVDEFNRALDDACRRVEPPMTVTADLTEVTFMSSAGVTVLLAVHHRCRRRGTPLRVRIAHHTVSRALEITGVDRVLELERD